MQLFLKKYHVEDEVVAAGVSGGADSLALALRLKECGKKVIALTVDHGLRPESSREADYVAHVMKAYGIEHHILRWEGEKPKTGIEAAAREARYDLLCGWCLQHGVRFLAVGQHQRDQAETFLLRLQRGSGLFGLSGILPVVERDGIKVIRPQLMDTPQFLRDYLYQRNIQWVEDPSNQCEDFQRVKIRHFLPIMEEKIGISVERLAETAAVLARTREYLEQQIDVLLKNHVRWWNGVLVSMSKDFLLSLHSEMRYRLLAVLLRKIGGKPYAPEAEELLRLAEDLQHENFKGATLGDCEIFFARRRLWVVPEQRKKEVLTLKQWEKFALDYPNYAQANLPYKVRLALYNKLAKR